MGDLSKRHLSLVLQRIVLNAHTKADPPLGAASQTAFHAVRDPALFAESVRHSIDTIRKAAAGLVVGPAAAPAASVADYMAALRRAVPPLTAATCEAYIDVYDDATDPDAEPITQQQYDEFVANFFDILALLEPYTSPTTAAPHAPLRKSSAAVKPTSAAAATTLNGTDVQSTGNKPRRRAKGKRSKDKTAVAADAVDPDDGVELRSLNKPMLDEK